MARERLGGVLEASLGGCGKNTGGTWQASEATAMSIFNCFKAVLEASGRRLGASEASWR